jgi:uncharacterized membrane protein
MPSNLKLLQSAVAGVIALGIAQGAAAQDAKTAPKEKCYGVVKAGQNDCATARHSCAGKSSRDNSPDEWKYVPKGTCDRMGGKTTAPGADPGKAPRNRAY